jgi:hypothetical protein
MLDDAPTPTSGPEPRCMWCSAVLPSDHETVCPSCGATLVDQGDAAVPGLTAIDADAILRNARGAARARPRGGRLLSWISGEYAEDDAAAGATPGSLAPPPVEVRREMLRLELEAQVANAQAEVEAMAADAAVEDGTSLATRASGDVAAASEPALPAALATPGGEPASATAEAVDGGTTDTPPA